MCKYSLKHRTFSGEWSSVLSREIFERGGVAAVIPFDPIRDEVVLIEQFRPGPMAAGHSNPWTVEIVAGILEEGETPEALAHRETEEETGGTLQALNYVNNFFNVMGKTEKFDITDINIPNFKFKISCSKGTYIRSLAHDFGAKL